MNGVRQIGKGFVDILAALFGLPEMQRRYDSSTMAEVAQCLDKQHLLKSHQIGPSARMHTIFDLSFYEEGTWLITPDGVKHDLRPFFDPKVCSLISNTQLLPLE